MTSRVIGRAALSVFLYGITLVPPYLSRRDGQPLFMGSNEILVSAGLIFIGVGFLALAAWAIWNYRVWGMKNRMMVVPFTTVNHLGVAYVIFAFGALVAGANPI